MIGGAAADTINGNLGNDLIIGDNGTLTTVVGHGIWTVTTLATTDSSTATGGVDTIGVNDLDSGDDVILGGVAGDIIHGNTVNDLIIGDNGIVTNLAYNATGLNTIGQIVCEVSTLGGNDTITGDDGNDILIGGAAADTINGNLGNDLIIGDNGTLTTVA